MKKKRQRKRWKTPEQMQVDLAAYWRKRVGLVHSDFDDFLSDDIPTTIRLRPPAMSSDHWGRLPFKQLASHLAHMVARGFPLSYFEYHIAVALGFLLSQLDYEYYYRHHWHETTDHQGYMSRAECPTCHKVSKRSDAT